MRWVGSNSYTLKHYRLSRAHRDKMVARCLPVFKVSVSLIMPPAPSSLCLTCVLFSRTLATHTHLLIPISLFFDGLSPSCISCGVYLQFGPNWNHIGEQCAILMNSLWFKLVRGTQQDFLRIQPCLIIVNGVFFVFMSPTLFFYSHHLQSISFFRENFTFIPCMYDHHVWAKLHIPMAFRGFSKVLV